MKPCDGCECWNESKECMYFPPGRYGYPLTNRGCYQRVEKEQPCLVEEEKDTVRARVRERLRAKRANEPSYLK